MMSGKRFFTKVNKNGRNVIIDKECHIELIDLTLACEVLNKLDLKLKTYNEQLKQLQDLCGESDGENAKLRIENKEQQATITHLEKVNGKNFAKRRLLEQDNLVLRNENERLRKQIQNYEQLLSNSYVGEEETLDGFVGKYVIWETELQKYRKKIKKVIDV